MPHKPFLCFAILLFVCVTGWSPVSGGIAHANDNVIIDMSVLEAIDDYYNSAPQHPSPAQRQITKPLIPADILPVPSHKPDHVSGKKVSTKTTPPPANTAKTAHAATAGIPRDLLPVPARKPAAPPQHRTVRSDGTRMPAVPPSHVNAEVIVQTEREEDKNTTQAAQSDITDISHNPMPEKTKIDPFGYVDISAQTQKQNVTENAGGGIGNITATSQPMPKTSTQSKNMTRAPKAENIKPENITAKTGAHKKNDANETTKSARKSAADNKKNVTEAPAPPPLPHMPPAPDINANVNAINDQGDDKRVEEKRITYELFFDGHNEDIPNAQKELLGEKVDDILDQRPAWRIQINSYAQSPDQTDSGARRLSLSRALALRSYLLSKSIPASRIDIKALGNDTDKQPVNRTEFVFYDPNS